MRARRASHFHHYGFLLRKPLSPIANRMHDGTTMSTPISQTGKPRVVMLDQSGLKMSHAAPKAPSPKAKTIVPMSCFSVLGAGGFPCGIVRFNHEA
jgi:hypothetical protein